MTLFTDVAWLHLVFSLHTAIERAMTYLNTGGLPWDMDLFTSRNDEVFPRMQTPSPPRPPPPRPPTPKKEEVEKKEEESMTEKNAFMEKLKKLHETRGEQMPHPLAKYFC